MPYDRSALLTQLKIDEGFRERPYKDTEGKLTIGYGTNLDAGITELEGEYLCGNRVTVAEQALTRNIPWWLDLSDNRQMALVNLCFNMGWGDGTRGLSTFKNMFAALHAGDFGGAAEDLLNSKYAKQVGARAQRIAALITSG